MGCGRLPSPGPTANVGPTADVTQQLVVNGATRTYRLAVPSTYRRPRPTPLILLFHGSGSDALQASLYTGLPRRGAQAGFLVATPDAMHGQWELSTPGAHSADLEFVHDLITHLSASYCVDPARIYTAGFSQGSELAAIVGCASADRIAAIGLVAAEFLLRPCHPPLSVIAFHGTRDPLVPYDNGAVGASLPGVPVVGVEQNLADWAELNRCRADPVASKVTSTVTRQVWSPCVDGSKVVLYTVTGGGHAWPGTPYPLPASTFGPTTEEVDATGLVLQFFGVHQLRR
jgi:polyhydroxybutyrate depolymerase